MNKELSSFAARLRGTISHRPWAIGHRQFSELALELFALQFQHNPAYRNICAARHRMPGTVEHWTQIPFVPTNAFKELELTCLPPDEYTAVFHSSGTTEQKPSRHFHGAASLAVYESSLWPWFKRRFLGGTDPKAFGAAPSPDPSGTDRTETPLHTNRGGLTTTVPISVPVGGPPTGAGGSPAPPLIIFLTPNSKDAPHSSLVYMFETVRKNLAAINGPADDSSYCGRVQSDGAWGLNFDAVLAAVHPHPPAASRRPVLILGTAFSFVHLLDFLAENQLRFELPAGSRVMETGGYKNRSRALPKSELHALITQRLGIERENIICEYGMSELCSQAYDSEIHPPSSILHPRVFHFPPWARVQIISPETGGEVADGETGLIRILDLANVFSVAAIQTEDLGIRRGEGFELIGRAERAEPRGCSLNSLEASRH